MKKSRFDNPLRVFWDINFSSSFNKTLPKEDILDIAGKVVSARPFFVNLGEDILSCEYLNNILEKFKPAGIKPSLSSSSLIKDDDKYNFLKEHKIDFLEFKLDPHIDEITKDKNYLNKINDTLEVYKAITKKVCPSLVITAKNYFLLPFILDSFIQHGIRYFKMPNTLINDMTADKVLKEHLSSEDIKELGKLIKDRVGYFKSNIDFFIHDLFIFRIFFKTKDEGKIRAEYGGCQAANALCYIDQSGELYLCSSFHVSLGSVLEHDIKTLFKSEKRLNYKRMIDEQFDEKCIQCIDFNECRGGCRGVVYFINDSVSGLDPLCPYAEEHGTLPKRAP
jgi:GeoRSP system SPASM domain protein